MPGTRHLCLAVALAGAAAGQQAISFASPDGGRVYGDLYGKGERGVVLAHGGRFLKESWRDQARALASAGFRVLAFDFRGFGRSTGPGQADFDTAPFENDVLAAVRYREPCSLSRARTPTARAYACRAFARNMRKPLNRKNSSCSTAPRTPSFCSKPIRAIE